MLFVTKDQKGLCADVLSALRASNQKTQTLEPGAKVPRNAVVLFAARGPQLAAKSGIRIVDPSLKTDSGLMDQIKVDEFLAQGEIHVAIWPATTGRKAGAERAKAIQQLAGKVTFVKQQRETRATTGTRALSDFMPMRLD